MPITKRTYKKKYVIGGSGIGITAAKVDIGMKTIDAGKTVTIDAGKKLVEKAAKRLSVPKLQVANIMVPPEEIT